MTSKVCFKCQELLSLDQFYVHSRMGDGHLNKCKECCKADEARRRKLYGDGMRAYDRQRANLPHRIAARKEYAQTLEGIAASVRAHRKYATNYPDRRAAHITLGNAVRVGKVRPWPVCAIPSCADAPEGHHPDYSRPLDVVWLCPAHHRQAHALTGRIISGTMVRYSE